MAQDAATLLVRIEATTMQLRKELAAADRAVSGSSSKIDKELGLVDKAFARMGLNAEQSRKAIGSALAGITAAAAGGVAGLGALVVSTANSAREIQNLSQVANASTTEFQRYAVGAKTVGIEQEKLSDILKDVNDRIGDFVATGGGPMKDFFEQIAPRVGVTAEQFRKLSGPQALQLYYDSLQKANLSQADMTFYLEAMASDTTALIPLLKDGGAGFSSLADEAERLGLIMSENTLRQFEQFNAQMDTAKMAAGGFGTQIATEALPALSELNGLLIDFAQDSEAASVVGDALGIVLKGVATAAIGVSTTFANVGRALGGLAAAAVAAVNLEFGQAGSIIDQFIADNETATTTAEQRIKKLWSGEYAEAGKRAVAVNTQVATSNQLLEATSAKAAKAIEKVDKALMSVDADGPAKAIKEFKDRFDALHDSLNPAEVAARKYKDQQEFLNEVIARGGEEAVKAARDLDLLREQYEANNQVTSDWAKWTEGALDRVDSAFADAWRNIGDGFDSFRDSLTNAFKQMLAELAHMAITKPIIMQIGAMMGVGNGTQGNNGIWGSLLGGGSASSGAGGIGGALQAANQARSLYSMYGTAQTLLPVLQGGYASGGIGGALTGIGSYVGSLFGGAGTAASMAAGSTAAGYTGSAYASWAAAQAAGSAGAGAAAGGIGGALSGALSSAASMWYLAPLIGAWQSGKLYDQGVRPDASETWKQGGNTALGKISNVGPTFQSKFFEVLDSGLQKASFGLVDGKLAAMISGSTFHQALWGGINKALFGGSWETKDGGIALGAIDGDLTAQQYIYQKKKGGLFSSSKKRTRYSALDDETLAMLQDTYDATEAGVSDLLARIGVSVTDGAYDGLEIARRQISTKGKTEEEISAAIAEWFEFAGDRMIAEIDQGIGGFGYSLAELTQRINVFESVNDALDLIDVAVLDLSAHSMELANGMAQAAGGMDAFSAGITTYYQAFFTAAEQQEKTLQALIETFEDADQVLAGSRQDYRDMVEAIDVTTEAGRELFNTLMGLATQADAYYDILESRAAEAINAAGAAFSGLQAAINAEVGQLRTQYQAAQASANELLQLSGTLQSALRSMRMESDAFDQARRKQAQAQLTSALAFGRAGGDLTTLDLSGSLSELGRDSTQFYGTFEEYARDYWKTANDINSLDQLAGKQLSVEEKTLEAIESQISYYDQMLLDAQNELNALMGIDTSVQSVAAALANFKVAVGAAQTAKDAAAPKTAKQTIADTYRSVLGRDAGSAELNYWLQRIGEGTATTSNLADLFKTSDEYKKGGFATGGYTGAGGKWEPAGIVHKGEVVWSQSDIAKWGGVGMVEAMRKNGPELEVTGPSRIYSASQTAAMLSGGADTAAAITRLQQTVERQGDALRSIAKHTMQTARRVEYLERWDGDGLPPERDVA